MSFVRTHLDETKRIIDALDVNAIDRMADALAALRQRGGRLFFLGVGGSAGNCSHAVNDFRKLAGIEAYAPTDNVSELTARTNDEGWETVFAEWLKVSKLNAEDALFVFSVGGGKFSRKTSVPTSCARCNMPRQSEPRFSAWSAATAAIRLRLATPSALCRRSTPTLSRRIPKRFRPSSGICL